MLTKGDEYPIHQTPEPIAFSGTDRNFYDRYFFNGYDKEGSLFFAAALGCYPHVNIMDGSFCVVKDGVQYNLHASRILNMERMEIYAGPIHIDIVEPLVKLRVHVDENEHGISCDLTFTGRAPALKEPRFTYRQGPRAFMDVTRMTQNGSWDGWINLNGERIEISGSKFLGTRDRSWGVRPIGSADAQPMAPALEPQFYWLWAPLNFEDRITLFHVNDDAKGVPWNMSGVMCPLGLDAEAEHMQKAWADVEFISGSRHAKGATIHFRDHDDRESTIELTPHWHFYMTGLGYGNPEWTHGGYKGENVVGLEVIRQDDIKSCAPPHLHIQAFVDAKLTLPDGQTREGFGILEQMIIGKHAPSGFKDILDMAP